MPVSLHILVVDDEPDLADLVRQKFRRKIRTGNYTFTFAHDGLEALDQLDASPDIRLVLTDLNMPRMDGMSLLTHLEEREYGPKAIVISAYGDMVNIRAAMNRGSFDFLTKPIDLNDLERTIEKAYHTIIQQQEADLARQIFGRYLSDEVASTLLKHPGRLKLGGEKRKVTIMMSDLRGFSTISERLPPEQVVDILNIYLGKMADVITAYKGTIDEYIGDAILAIFGAPIQHKDDQDDAVRAIACALAMQHAMTDVNDQLEALGFPRLEMGIGINTGDVVVGNIGSEKRTKYAVVGSHVNLTSRIESYTVGGQVLVTEYTLNAAGPEAQIGRGMKLSAKGFSEPINIYEVESIGPPYSLTLPIAEAQLVTLNQPWTFTYSVLDGKHLTSLREEGTIQRLGTSGAVIQTTQPVAVMDNLRIVLTEPEQPSKHIGDLYAKVIACPADGVHIRFTAVPEDVGAAIQRRCTS